MAPRISRKNLLVAVLIWFIFISIPGPAGRFVRAQERGERETATEVQPPEGDESEEKGAVAPTPQAPQSQPVPQTPPAGRGQPPVATPERRLSPAPAAPRGGGGEMVSLNFNRADLIEVIHVLAQHLRLTYTIDPDVKGTVTINSAEPLRKDDLLPVFHQILRMNGAVAVKSGDIYRIAPIEKGKGLARPVESEKDGGYAIQVVPVRFFSVAEMKRLLTPFVTPGGDIFDYPRGNFLMIVDLPSNIQRLMEIRDMIDVQTFVGTKTEIYQPKVASADELQAEMTKVMQAYASSSAQQEGFAAQFLSIPRINQLLVIADSEAAWTYVKRWLERLDTLGEGPGRKIHIYPVENGKASELADVLTQVLGITAGAQRQQGRTLEQIHRSTSGASPPTTPGLQRTPGMVGTPFGAFAVAPAQPQQQQPTTPPQATTPPRPQQQQPPRPGEARPGDTSQIDQVRIVADTTTNTLIIYGSAQEFQNIRMILKELDIPPRQVVLECLVAEVKAGPDSNSLGFDYQLVFGGTLKGKGGNTGFTDAFTSTKAAPFPIQLGATKGLAALIGDDRVRGLVTALQNDSRSKILASPTILATDNQAARIQVGDEVPVATGTISSALTGSTGVTTAIQSRNTGKIMTIIPQVNSKGLVNLQIKVEVSRPAGNVTVGDQSFPSFSTRDVETTAVVKDGEALVIGGIFAEDRDRSRSGIPFLMDIPVFGWFFRKTTETLTERTELIIIIMPHVIRDVEESRKVTDEFKKKLSTVAGEIENMRRGGAKEDLPPPKVQPVVPDKESSAAPELAPEGRGASAPGGNNQNGVMPAAVNVQAPPSPGAWKTIVKFLSFGLVD
ncbi:MAG TPA: type II secretion system secretin GspD [Candidatus Binatia bacterium]|jgi:general secretion pathway protein D